MSSYEIDLKNEYTNKGYRFIGDIVAESADVAIKRAISVSKVPREKIVCLQGECIAFNNMRRRGISRWLLFENPNTRR